MLKLLERFYSSILMAIFLNIALSSCAPKIEKHGYMFDLSDHHLLQEEIITKSKVLSIMGSPTLISDLNGEEMWIYYAENVKKLLFFKPDIVNREIILLAFDNNEVLKKLENYSLANEKKLNFSSDHTKVKSNKVGFFKSIFSNVGQIRPQ